MAEQRSDSENDRQQASAEPCFEEALSRLEGIVHDLEEGDIGLAEALARYEDGVKLLRQCFGMLEGAERRIELLSGLSPEGEPQTEPFDDEDSLSLEIKAERRTRRRPVKRPARKAPPVDAEDDGRGELFE